MRRDTRLHRRANAALCCAISIALGASEARAQLTLPIGDKPSAGVPYVLKQVARVGSLSRDADAFARVAFVALDERGGFIVADDRTPSISRFDVHGRLVSRVNQRGQGPGELQAPWLVAVLSADSVAVWDAALARVTIFSPALKYVRSFPVTPGWVVNSLRELPSGDFLVSAFDRTTKSTLHFLSREGKYRYSFAPVTIPSGVFSFEESLLGGTAVVVNGQIVVSYKTPYRIDIFDLAGRLQKSCVGNPKLTTPPQQVIEQRANGASLKWSQYVHSTALLRGPRDDVLLNLIVDRINDRFMLDAIAVSTCRLLRRSFLPAPVYLSDGRNEQVAGFVEINFPEVLIYSVAASSSR